MLLWAGLFHLIPHFISGNIEINSCLVFYFISLPSPVYSLHYIQFSLICKLLMCTNSPQAPFQLFSLPAPLHRPSWTPVWGNHSPLCIRLLLSGFSCVWGNPSFPSMCKHIFSVNSLDKLDVPFKGFHTRSVPFCQRTCHLCGYYLLTSLPLNESESSFSPEMLC